MAHNCKCGATILDGYELCLKCRSELLKPCKDFYWHEDYNGCPWCRDKDERTSIDKCHNCMDRVPIKED